MKEIFNTAEIKIVYGETIPWYFLFGPTLALAQDDRNDNSIFI